MRLAKEAVHRTFCGGVCPYFDMSSRNDTDDAQQQQKMGAKDRLAYLMKQTDIFAHFVKSTSGEGGGASSNDKGGKTGRKGKGRMTEKQEDEMLLKESDTKAEGTRLLVQPKVRPGAFYATPLQAFAHVAVLCRGCPPRPRSQDPHRPGV